MLVNKEKFTDMFKRLKAGYTALMPYRIKADKMFGSF